MPQVRKYWGVLAVLQGLGAALVFVGSYFSAAVQIVGMVALLPGSVVAASLPLHKLWNPAFWRLWQTDSAGLANVLYLPVALLTNVLIWWAICVYRRHRSRGEKGTA